MTKQQNDATTLAVMLANFQKGLSPEQLDAYFDPRVEPESGVDSDGMLLGILDPAVHGVSNFVDTLNDLQRAQFQDIQDFAINSGLPFYKGTIVASDEPSLLDKFDDYLSDKNNIIEEAMPEHVKSGLEIPQGPFDGVAGDASLLIEAIASGVEFDPGLIPNESGELTADASNTIGLTPP